MTPSRLLTLPLSAALLLAACSLSACGGSSYGDADPTKTSVPATLQPSATPNDGAADDALAASMLMTREDVPGDYLEKAKTVDEVTTLADLCGRSNASGATGRAATRDFLFDGQSPAMSEVVVVFSSDAEAQASVEGAQEFVDCAIDAMNQGKLDDEKVKFSGATSAEVTVDAGSDTSYATQITATKEYAGQTARGTAQFTVVFGSEGRAVYELSTRGSGEPMDLEVVAETAQAAAARIHQLEDP